MGSDEQATRMLKQRVRAVHAGSVEPQAPGPPPRVSLFVVKTLHMRVASLSWCAFFLVCCLPASPRPFSLSWNRTGLRRCAAAAANAEGTPHAVHPPRRQETREECTCSLALCCPCCRFRPLQKGVNLSARRTQPRGERGRGTRGAQGGRGNMQGGTAMCIPSCLVSFLLPLGSALLCFLTVRPWRTPVRQRGISPDSPWQPAAGGADTDAQGQQHASASVIATLPIRPPHPPSRSPASGGPEGRTADRQGSAWEERPKQRNGTSRDREGRAEDAAHGNRRIERSLPCGFLP
jgi:hypothetical protein